jgi:hypothetical protein
MSDSIKQKISSGNGNIQSGRDTIVNPVTYNTYEQRCQKDIGIIEDILTFIFNSKIIENNIASIKKTNKDKLTELKEKIPLNCKDANDEARIKEMINNLWSTKELVERYLSDVDDQGKVLRLKEMIVTEFDKLKQSYDNLVDIFNALPMIFLQDEQKTNPDYCSGAKAIAIYFFEYCDIGSKTKKESANIKSLFE